MRVTVALEPFTPEAALHVLQRLDEHDQLEAELARGDPAEPFDMLASWMGLEAQGAAVFVGREVANDAPFAVLAIVPGATPGLGHAAMLACDHAFWRRALVPLVRQIRDGFPDFAAHMGLHRIEARSWAGHPTAPSLLRAIGFELEAAMIGFGQSGEINFNQWAWVADYIPRPPKPQKET